MQFVTRLSNSTMEALLAELPQEKQLELGARSRVVEVLHQKQRYVIAGGVWRPQRDPERRTLRLAKAQSALTKMAQVKRKKVAPQKPASPGRPDA